METSKKKRSCSDSLSTDTEEWLSTRTDKRGAKLLEAQRRGKLFVMNKIKRQAIKRGIVRDVTTPDETISDSCCLQSLRNLLS